MKSKILIIGNKPYLNIDLGSIIDSFDNNVRCNMGIPYKNNGTKKDKLALCCHLYKNLIKKKISNEKLISDYKCEYKENYLRFFCENFSIDDYNEIIPEVSKNNFIVKYNDYLKKIKCPYRFSQQPRTGHSIIMKYLMSDFYVHVIGFSITNEIRKTYYVQDFIFEKEEKNKTCHNKKDELNILRWLHSNNLIDASLCLLEDRLPVSLVDDKLKPSEYTIDLLKNVGL